MTHTIADALRDAQALGLDRLDAQILLLHCVGRDRHDRAWLLAHDDAPLTPAQQAAYTQLVQRRLQDEPLAYLVGEREFFGLTLHVDVRVLDPRPDTETLVEWALACLPPALETPRLLDLGTGSGAIALALQHACPRAEVWAVDASADALDVARANATRLGLPVRFAHGDWFAPLFGANGPPSANSGFDLIVSNPPYIADGDPHLARLGHEPRDALTSGADGLDDIRRIVAQASAHLRADGWLLLEHGHDQADAVCALLRAHGFAQVQSRHDLAGIARCSGGQWAAVE